MNNKLRLYLNQFLGHDLFLYRYLLFISIRFGLSKNVMISYCII